MIAGKSFEVFNISTSVTFISEVDQIIKRMISAGSTPSIKYRKAINRWVSSEIDNGNYAISDSWYVFEAEDEMQAKINWKTSVYNPTEPVACPFTAGVGYKSNGTGYLNSNFGPGDGVNFIIDDNSLIIYTPEDGGTSASRVVGVEDGARDFFIQFTSASAGFQANWTNGLNEAFTSTISNGLWAMVRTANNLTTLYQNNISKGTSADLSSAFAWSKPFFLCANNANDTADRFDITHTLGFALFGSSLIDRADLEDGHDQYLIDIS